MIQNNSNPMGQNSLYKHDILYNLFLLEILEKSVLNMNFDKISYE